jgi:hypothetical protein
MLLSVLFAENLPKQLIGKRPVISIIAIFNWCWMDLQSETDANVLNVALSIIIRMLGLALPVIVFSQWNTTAPNVKNSIPAGFSKNPLIMIWG